jgi:hypothetical protein
MLFCTNMSKANTSQNLRCESDWYIVVRGRSQALTWGFLWLHQHKGMILMFSSTAVEASADARISRALTHMAGMTSEIPDGRPTRGSDRRLILPADKTCEQVMPHDFNSSSTLVCPTRALKCAMSWQTVSDSTHTNNTHRVLSANELPNRTWSIGETLSPLHNEALTKKNDQQAWR